MSNPMILCYKKATQSEKKSQRKHFPLTRLIQIGPSTAVRWWHELPSFTHTEGNLPPKMWRSPYLLILQCPQTVNI